MSAIAPTDMASCGSCDKSHDLSKHPLLDRDLANPGVLGTPYECCRRRLREAYDEGFREERHITEVRNDVGFDNERDGWWARTRLGGVNIVIRKACLLSLPSKVP